MKESAAAYARASAELLALVPDLRLEVLESAASGEGVPWPLA
ncbi:MAG TPA: hypothetical protein VK698_07660 [Kofleriaceae bacterium]|nr:hypothetical protein [Kofleriaceae bacterium]